MYFSFQQRQSPKAQCCDCWTSHVVHTGLIQAKTVGRAWDSLSGVWASSRSNNSSSSEGFGLALTRWPDSCPGLCKELAGPAGVPDEEAEALLDLCKKTYAQTWLPHSWCCSLLVIISSKLQEQHPPGFIYFVTAPTRTFPISISAPSTVNSTHYLFSIEI